MADVPMLLLLWDVVPPGPEPEVVLPIVFVVLVVLAVASGYLLFRKRRGNPGNKNPGQPDRPDDPGNNDPGRAPGPNRSPEQGQ